MGELNSGIEIGVTEDDIRTFTAELQGHPLDRISGRLLDYLSYLRWSREGYLKNLFVSVTGINDLSI